MARSGVFHRDDLEAALDFAGVGLWASVVATNEVRWSAQTEALFGVEPGTFGGTLDDYLARIEPDDLERVYQVIRACLAPGGGAMHFEHRVIRNGEVRWLECRGRVERDAQGQPLRMLGTVMDVTERKLAEREKEQTDATLRLLSELTSDYVYQLDESELAAEAAPQILAGSFEGVVGLRPDQVVERGGWLSVIHPDDLPKTIEINAALMNGQPLVAEYRIVDGAGEVRWLRDTMRPVVQGGTLVRLTGGVKEITREKTLEQQWLQAQKLEALALLAGGIAHDFNNVLAVIHSGIDVVVRRAGLPQDEVLTDIRDAAQRAAELTRGLLAFARKPLGPAEVVSMEAELGGLKPVLMRGLDELHPLAFEVVGGSAAVRIEPGQLQVLLLNLVINAKDAMPGGGVVRVNARSEVLDAGDRRRPADLAPGPCFVIEVSDTGVGMNAEVRAHLFQPFFTTKGARGTGLGLASCHGIAVRAGGGITVHSVVGQGTTFWVVLPMADERPQSRPQAQVSIGGVERVMLVEDEPALRRIAARALTERGYAVWDFGSAEEVLALPVEQLASVALIVSDVGLPGMNGTTLVQKLLVSSPKLKVLVISGYLPDAQAEAMVERGELHFLPKPFSAEGLARRVREVLDT